MGYDLGNVKPWVKAAANSLGKKFGIKDIGGWRAQGSVPGSLHPKGRAIDLMTSNKSVGQNLADFARANAKALGITEVIWNRKIWTTRRAKEGWRPYSGPSDHTDHVHLSFQDTAPKGGVLSDLPDIPFVPDPSDLVDAVKSVGGALTDIAGTAAKGGKLADQLMKLALPTNMIRLVVGGFGFAFLFIGIFFLMRAARNA